MNFDEYYSKNRMRIAAKVAVSLGMVMPTTGCASLVGESIFTGPDEGRMLISADAEGLRALNDGLTGLIAQGKVDTEDGTTAYWNNRKSQERERTFRIVRPGSAKKGSK